MEIVHNAELILSDIENRMVSAMKDLSAGCMERFLSLPDFYLIMKSIIREKSHKLDMAFNSISNLSPLAILKKGYSITMDLSGRLINTSRGVAEGDRVNVVLTDGSFESTVNNVSGEVYFGRKKEKDNG